MVRITKIFHFEMGHAIHGYQGRCQYIHGHSYELHVTVSSGKDSTNYLPAPGFVIDFKELKQIVQSNVINQLDHQLVLSQPFIKANPGLADQKNLTKWEVEPSAENLIIFIHQILEKNLPTHIQLIELKLFETKDSYAQWSA